MREKGNYIEAGDIANKNNKHCGRILRQEDADILKCTSVLVAVYRAGGRENEVDELSVKVIEARRIVLELEHSDTLGDTNILVHTGTVVRSYSANENCY